MSEDKPTHRRRPRAAPENASAQDNPITDDTTQRRQCTAKAKSTGKRCGVAPIEGGTVCAKHGGSAPQVKDAARRRLNALAEPAVVELEKILKHPGTTDKEKLRAVQLILDRTGHGPSSKFELDPPWQAVVVGVISEDGQQPAEWRQKRYEQYDPDEDDD